MYKGAFITTKGYVVGIPKSFDLVCTEGKEVFVYSGEKPPHQSLSELTDESNVMIGVVADLRRMTVATTKYDGSTTIINKSEIKDVTDQKALVADLIERVVIE